MYKVILALMALLAVCFAACGDDDDGSDATTTAASSATPGDATDGATEVTITSETFVPTVTLTGLEGWNAFLDNANEFPIEILRTVSAPGGLIAFLLPDQVYDANDATQKVDRPADWVEYFTTHPVITTNSQEETTLGGLSGTKLSLTAHNVADIPLVDFEDGLFELRFNAEFQAYVLDSGDEQLLVLVEPENPAQSEVFFEMVQPALDSLEISP